MNKTKSDFLVYRYHNMFRVRIFGNADEYYLAHRFEKYEGSGIWHYGGRIDGPRMSMPIIFNCHSYEPKLGHRVEL